MTYTVMECVKFAGMEVASTLCKWQLKGNSAFSLLSVQPVPRRDITIPLGGVVPEVCLHLSDT